MKTRNHRPCRRLMSSCCGELTEQARAGGLKLTGEGGLLGKLTKMVTEDALGVRDSHRPTTPETSTANTTDIGQEALY